VQIYTITDSTTLNKEHIYTITNSITLNKEHIYTITNSTTLSKGHIYTIINSTTLSKGHIYTITDSTTLNKEHIYTISGNRGQVCALKVPEGSMTVSPPPDALAAQQHQSGDPVARSVVRRAIPAASLDDYSVW
jgi:hypothetical protein